MAKKSIDIIISTVLKKTGIDAAGAALKSLSARAASFGKAVGANLMNIKAGFDMAIAAARKFMEVIKLGIELEKMTYSFKSLVGSIDDARKHMADLQELGRTPPFDLQSFAAASREMLKMSGGVLGLKDDLKIVGDMAAATGNDIRTVGHAFGLAYQSIRDGEGFGRAGSQLVQLGILTKKQVGYFDELTKSGKSNAEVWDEFVKVVNRYEGAMADVEKTTGGVIDAIGGEATLAMTSLGDRLMKMLNPALEKLLAYIRDLNDSGKIDKWAESAEKSINGLAISIEALGRPIAWVGGKLADMYFGVIKGFRVAFRTILEFVGAAKGALVGGGGLKDAWEQASDAVKQAWNDEFDDGDDSEAERRAQAEQKRIEEAAKKEREEAERTAKLKEDLARAQEERDRKAAEKKAKEAADFAKKKAEIERDAAEKIDDIENGENERLDLEGAYGRVEDARKFVADAANEDELKAAKKSLDAALANLSKQKKLKERLDDEDRRKSEDSERELFRQKAENLRKLHDQQMDALDKQKAKLDEQVAKLNEMGAANPFRMAQILDQGAMLKDERQAKIDEARFEKARDALEKRMRRAGIDPNGDLKDVSKLGRLSNLDRATLERMRLDKAQEDAKVLEQRKIKLAEDTKKLLDDIANRLKNTGL